MENHTAKHFVTQLGSLVSLYLSLSFLLVLIFGLINLAFPDAANSVWEIESAASSVRIGIAIVLVFFPTYVYLTRLVNSHRRNSTDNNYLGLTKWLVYLSLLVGGGVLLGDFVAVIVSFLQGEITQRFVLKALAVLVVVGGAFYYYLKDARGYWVQNEKQSVMFAGIMSLIVLISVVAGFMQIPTPTEYREQKLDQTQVNDLQNIQWKINDYLAINSKLPDDLESLYSDQAPAAPTAPDNRSPYLYKITETGFSLCATFAQETPATDFGLARPNSPTSETPTILNPDNWSHSSGEFCFERAVR